MYHIKITLQGRTRFKTMCKTTRNYAKPRETTQNHAKPCETTQNHAIAWFRVVSRGFARFRNFAKPCETTRNHAKPRETAQTPYVADAKLRGLRPGRSRLTEEKSSFAAENLHWAARGRRNQVSHGPKPKNQVNGNET